MTMVIAWAAGLFEGEGCFYLRRSGGYTYGVTMSLTSTDEDVVRRFAQIVACGSVHGPYRHKNSTKDCWEWKLQNHKESLRLFGLFRPWLGERRLHRYEELLALWEQSRPKK